GLEAGPSGSLGYITQNLPTYPGQTYLLSFWLSNPSSGSTEQFQASWNGTIIYSVSNPGVLAWTNQKFIVTATGTNTVLQFGLRNDPAYFGIDDISVTPVALPAITQQPTNQTVAAGNTAIFSASVTGTAP